MTSRPTDTTPSDTSGEATRSVTLIAGTAILALLVGTLLGWLVFADSTPGDDSAEAGFARDMTEHHAQAVEMSLQVIHTTDDQDIRTLATDIASTQGNQMGQMEGWIRTWDLPMAASGERMAWMADVEGYDDHSMAEHDATGAMMPGMATSAQMEELRSLEGEAADILYLQLMTTHHIAGIDMAQAALDAGVEDEVQRLSAAMVNGQEAEIALMTDMLHARDAQTLEESGEDADH
ncbi:DUF305 domain-containing protein [Ornithinimicrobium cryptoxanthini]|uniref:DUF305 domain-containing protein n=1 Tax=Ornithinimicrobium cryptoxanthini TaxID=2934161 RepID=UPI002117BFCD|nr:DUF305 domain-containing protein [Ornithinimicrobium cryptoxanthini]